MIVNCTLVTHLLLFLVSMIELSLYSFADRFTRSDEVILFITFWSALYSLFYICYFTLVYTKGVFN